MNYQSNKEKEDMKIEKIFVASPSNKDNGGGESLHQLVDACNRLGYDAYIYYFDSKRKDVLDKMSIYNIKVAAYVEDNVRNLLICPEMITYPLRKYKYIRKGIWFLSLDYYLRSLPFYRTKFVLKKWNIPKFLYPIVFFAVLIGTNATFMSFDFKKDRIKYFLYNVEYAHQYIEEKCQYYHISQYLCGPINDIYFSPNDINTYSKEKLVAYNPKKANSFTEKIISAVISRTTDIKFVAIQNLDQCGVKDILKRASVYMDFGYFPGPERIPREAAIMRCNIITSNLGSAANREDVPISSKYKFALEDDYIEDIVMIITDMVYNYENYITEFEQYRGKVIKQKAEFDMNVKVFLERIEKDET